MPPGRLGASTSSAALFTSAPSTPRSVKSSAFARFFMAATLFKILFAAFLTQNPLAARFFFMAGDMRPGNKTGWLLMNGGGPQTSRLSFESNPHFAAAAGLKMAAFPGKVRGDHSW